MALLRNENVGGLDVAMNYALGMRGIEGIGNLDSEREQGFRVQRFSVDPVAEGLTFQQFHGNKGAAIGFVDLIDGADVWMIESRGSFGFTLKTAKCLRIPGNIIPLELAGADDAGFA